MARQSAEGRRDAIEVLVPLPNRGHRSATSMPRSTCIAAIISSPAPRAHKTRGRQSAGLLRPPCPSSTPLIPTDDPPKCLGPVRLGSGCLDIERSRAASSLVSSWKAVGAAATGSTTNGRFRLLLTTWPASRPAAGASAASGCADFEILILTSKKTSHLNGGGRFARRRNRAASFAARSFTKPAIRPSSLV
ncbi:hypothetical protein SAMN05519103_03971 [Rhizobiales bacterium GAS113]|nr:hypothetical protein SAMN05519103_03971 [Rhizobiales bacterium GAS113]